MIQPSEDRVFPALEDLLSWNSKRQQALAANVANLDTPGYRSKDYSFEQQLMSSISMTATSPRHISLSPEPSSARVFDVGTREKPNGNNVDLEREMTEITKNGLQYITLVQYLTSKIKILRSAITEGGKS
jgi:flagellar basal-body rod protein FlgB